MIRTKTLLLHIGSWKTGTTAVQSYLSRHADRLAAAGISYPLATRDDGDRLDTAHHRLRQLLDDADGRMTRDLGATLGRMDAEIRQSGCDTLLLSSETFMGFRRPETLARYFAADHVVVLVGLRPQAEFVNALYYTEVCHLKVTDLPMDYLAGFDWRLFDYAALLDRWATVWPSTEIRASLFQRGTESRRFPVQSFLHQIGASQPLVDADNVVEHRTLPAQATLMLRQLAAAGYPDDDFFRVFQTLHANRDWFAPLTACFPPQALREIEARYAPSNARLLRKYMTCGTADMLSMDLPSQAEWEAAMLPLDRHLPAFVRHISRAAAA